MIVADAGNGGLRLSLSGRRLIDHTLDRPAFSFATGDPRIEMYRGNFAISDAATGHQAPPWCRQVGEHLWHFAAEPEGASLIEVALEKTGAITRLRVTALLKGADRLFVRRVGEGGEAIWGGGEQMSYLRLDGRRFPVWTSEPGVGRDKSTALTQAMDALGNAGGDYWTTNYPQPTFLTERALAVHVESTAFSVLDFSDPETNLLEMWEGEARIAFFVADDLPSLVSCLSDFFGRSQALPDWALEGAIVGLKDGANSFARLDRIRGAGASVSGLWCEDWCGIRETSFGRRLFWDWQWSRERYPDLPAKIAALRAEGIRFLGYVNPYLAVDGALYGEALAGGHLAQTPDCSGPYHVDFGEFDAALVDFTRPESVDWFAERVIGCEMLDIGIAGWMADFGEYLPTDVALSDGSDAMLEHNRWPVRWAEVNAKAIAARGQQDEAIFFMRAGFSGVQRHSPLLWAGDQSVDFSRHDGIGTVITAALSAGLVGNAASHSDVGGYTSVFDNVRSEELLLRWIELGAFSPVMRSHEGNRPDINLQIDSTPTLLAHFARFSRLHAGMAPYVRSLRDEAVRNGLPYQRPLFLIDHDPSLFAIQDQFAYGADMIVAPVIDQGSVNRPVTLPFGRWRHLFTGEVLSAGQHQIAAPIGQPPVFTREDSQFASLFASLAEVTA